MWEPVKSPGACWERVLSVRYCYATALLIPGDRYMLEGPSGREEVVC